MRVVVASGRSETVFRRVQNAKVVSLRRVTAFPSEEDELCDALEFSFAVWISRLAQSWQITSTADRFGIDVPMKS